MMRWLMWLSQILHLFLLLYSEVTSSSFPSSSSALLCSQDQSSALLQFKQLFSFSEDASSSCDEVGHHSYPKMESWKDATDCCSWDGVTCDSVRGDVIGLDLSCSWLYGTIPSNSTLFLLSHLQHLNLALNDFNSSSISSRFGQFASLSYLNLSNSAFSGQVPYELSQISQLASLDLSIFHLSLETSVVKRLVQNLTKLRDLHLDLIDMSSVSLTSFMNLSSSLMSLSLKSCRLQGRLPDNIFQLPNLRELNLFDNTELTGDFLLSNWSNPLRFLDLSKTDFSGELPKSIGNLKFLRQLVLNGCNFTGSVPASVGNLTQLTILDISNNHFRGEIPSSLSNLRELSRLDLSNNNLSGPIPVSLSFLKDLTLIDLRQNNFGGEIPDLFPNLTKLTDAYVSDNQLTGSTYYQYTVGVTVKGLETPPLGIPTIFTTIDLSSNKFQGEIPEALASLNFLRLLNLSHNSLTGSIPSSLANLSALESLDLSSNRLVGEIPMQLTSLTFLALLNLSQNHLTGPIPQGKQFATFQNDSYDGNLGLCGFPLSKQCRTDASPLPPPSIFQEDNDSMFASGFGWKAVLLAMDVAWCLD